MDRQFKKFNIPSSLNDESSEDVDDIPQYFRAGKVLENSKTENDSSKMSGPSCSKQNTTDKSMEYIAQKSIETKSVCDKAKTLSETEPSSNFGNAFSNLRASKFYDNTGQCTSENQTKTSEKFAKSSSSLLVNPRQRGNPLLKNIRNVPWEYNEMEPDYVMGKTTCALFLSMRYHNLFPNYIHERLKALGKSYQLRVLLVQVDILEPNQPLKDLSVIAILADCTLMVAWSPEEAGSYLETYKIFENKSADLIKEKQGDDNYSQLIDCLTTVRSVNKTDAVVLLSTFGTLEKVIEASAADLAMCPGMGPLKAKRLYEALRRPLKNEWRST